MHFNGEIITSNQSNQLQFGAHTILFFRFGMRISNGRFLGEKKCRQTNQKSKTNFEFHMSRSFMARITCADSKNTI